MRNNSQNAGCILRLPASHSCHPRMVQWMSSAAAVCESPAASRAARTSSGVGFRAALPARLRLGWLVVKFNFHPGVIHDVNAVIGFLHFQERFNGRLQSAMGGKLVCLVMCARRIHDCIVEADNMEFGSGGVGHFGLLPLVTRGAVVMQCASHELNNTRIACKRKNFLKLFLGGSGETAKPSNAKFSRSL